jgi:hypothetical protein
MVTTQAEYCDHCRHQNVVSFTVEPREARGTVVLNLWRRVCLSWVDQEAEKAGIKIWRRNSWSDQPASEVARSGVDDGCQ